MTIGEICNRETIFVTRVTSISEAARLMREKHVGDLVVVEEKGVRRIPVGIVTDRDLVIEILAKDVSPGTVTVGDVMNADLLTAQENDDTYLTMQRMRTKGVRRLPVVDASGTLVGIVTIDDFLDLLASELTSLARLVTNEQRRERRRRA
jgi:CBS domain-containing protein